MPEIPIYSEFSQPTLRKLIYYYMKTKYVPCRYAVSSRRKSCDVLNVLHPKVTSNAFTHILSASVKTLPLVFVMLRRTVNPLVRGPVVMCTGWRKNRYFIFPRHNNQKVITQTFGWEMARPFTRNWPHFSSATTLKSRVSMKNGWKQKGGLQTKLENQQHKWISWRSHKQSNEYIFALFALRKLSNHCCHVVF